MAEPATQDRHPAATPPPLPAQYTRGARKTRVGEVISDRMNKTIVVQTTTRVPHPKFGKIVKQIRRCYAHDEETKVKSCARFWFGRGKRFAARTARSCGSTTTRS